MQGEIGRSSRDLANPFHHSVAVRRHANVRQNKYLNNIVEQDHHTIQRIIKPMMGFKDFRCARIILAGIELMHMIRKEQMHDDGFSKTATEQFYSLVM